MKKSFDDVNISPRERKALAEIKQLLLRSFPIKDIIIFGSKVRGNAAKDSDLDLLIVTEKKLSHKQRGEISALAFEVDHKYQTLISLVIIDEESWYGPSLYTQLFHEIEEAGVVLT